MIKIGSNSVNAIYFGSSVVDRLYYNGEMIWPDGDCATKVTYVDGTEEIFKIKGKLTSSSIDNILDVIEVEIGLDVTSIGGYAFYKCSGLTSMTIPNSVTNIEEGAFSGCTSLLSVSLPDALQVINNNAFSTCTSCAVFDFGNTRTSIPQLNNTNAFQNLSEDYKIAVPDALYDTWVGATNWSDDTIRPHIVKWSDYDQTT